MKEKIEGIKAHIGIEISKRRKEAGFTQEDLAGYLGLVRISIMNIEAGRHGTTAETLWKICNALNCTPNDLFPKQQPAKTKTITVEKIVKVPTRLKVKKLTLLNPSNNK